MVMYSITTKLNSTFGTTGKATADKMTAKVVRFQSIESNKGIQGIWSIQRI